MVSLVLAHSPLTGPAAWGELPDRLRTLGHAVTVLDVRGDTEPPFAARFVAGAATQIAAADPEQPLHLVAHSGAGYLLPQLGFTQRAARRGVRGYVFVDAGIPAPRPATRLDLLAGEDAGLAKELGEHLTSGGLFPEWTDDDLRALIPGDALRASVVRGLRPRGRDFFTEPLPFPTELDWPDAPCGLLQTSEAYAGPARSARSRGWPVLERGGGHFAACADPDGVARDLLWLIGRL